MVNFVGVADLLARSWQLWTNARSGSQAYVCQDKVQGGRVRIRLQVGSVSQAKELEHDHRQHGHEPSLQDGHDEETTAVVGL
jgi:hypothetical protein